jgi:hypothetical protein
MLCPKCEAIRFPSAGVQACNLSTNTKKATQAGKKSSASKSKQMFVADGKPDETDISTYSDNTKLKTAVENIASLNSAGNEHISPPPVLPAVDVNVELCDLRSIVAKQQMVIKKLQSQLDYVLSFLGITEMPIELISEGKANMANTSADSQQSESQFNLGDPSAAAEADSEARRRQPTRPPS